MSIEQLKERTRAFAIDVIRLTSILPHTPEAQVIGRQLLRAAASVGANYRAACRAKSRADFVSKMKVVEEECDEAIYWMEILGGIGLCQSQPAPALKCEANEILSMVVTSIKTARTST